MFGFGARIIATIVGVISAIGGTLFFVDPPELEPKISFTVEERMIAPAKEFTQEFIEQFIAPPKNELRTLHLLRQPIPSTSVPLPQPAHKTLDKPKKTITGTVENILSIIFEPKTWHTPKNEGGANQLGIREQFTLLENELVETQISGFVLAPEHSERIKNDLSNLEAQGYLFTELERLRVLVLELSPHLRDIAKEAEESSSSASPYNTSPAGWFPPRGCSGDAVTFTDSPVDDSKITFIVPLGRMNGSHVTPTDHGYINTGEGVTASVRSPAAGEIVDIGAFPRPNDFRVTIWHSCTVSTIYIHLTDLAPDIRAHVGNLPPGNNWFGDDRNPLYVTAGQNIGTMRRSVDFSVHDTNVILSGFVTPSLYYGEAWKIHTVDLYDYFAEPLQTVLRGKSERTVAPIGGKIDHDIDGRLVGSWFLEGAGGYNAEPGDYWLSHLAIAYDHVTPTLIQISDPRAGINDQAVCNVCFNVYGVKGNWPDPANVSVASGPVKYELTAREHINNPRTGGQMTVNDESRILGVFLAEMISDRRIRVEVFPGKLANEVSGFTSAARMYQRDSASASVSVSSTLPPPPPPPTPPSITEPTPLSWILPFEVSDTYDPTTRSQGDISYAGSFVMIPFGQDIGGYGTPDIFFEVVPGTILKASLAGRVSVGRNPIGTTPEGEPFDPQDWELFIHIGDGPYWLEYDHMVDILVSDGEYVEIGQPLGRASPAAIRHGGSQGELPIDEFEWGLRRGGPTARAVCTFGYLTQSEQAKLTSVLKNMRSLGFADLPSVCTVQETSG